MSLRHLIYASHGSRFLFGSQRILRTVQNSLQGKNCRIAQTVRIHGVIKARLPRTHGRRTLSQKASAQDAQLRSCSYQSARYFVAVPFRDFAKGWSCYSNGYPKLEVFASDSNHRMSHNVVAKSPLKANYGNRIYYFDPDFLFQSRPALSRNELFPY